MIFEQVYKRLYDEFFLKTAGKNLNIELFKINKLDIPFSRTWKKVGINLSGGADSACLTYLLCKIISENNIDCKIDAISFIRMWETRPWQNDISIKVFNKLKTMFPNIINERHTNFIAPKLEDKNVKLLVNDQIKTASQIQNSNFNEYMLYAHDYNAIFNATTHNPYTEIVNQSPGERTVNHEEATVSHLVLEKYGIYGVFLPFKFVDKSWIIAQYHLFDILDLLEITRSCEGSVTSNPIKHVVPDIFSYKNNPNVKVPECGRCYWCQERNWAMEHCHTVIEEIKK